MDIPDNRYQPWRKMAAMSAAAIEECPYKPGVVRSETWIEVFENATPVEGSSSSGSNTLRAKTNLNKLYT